MISLRRRLLVTLLSLFVLAWVWLMGMTYVNAREEIHEVFDAQLAQAAHVLLELTRHELEEEESADDFRAEMFQDRLVHAYEKKVAFQVWRHGELLLRSPSAPETRMARTEGYGDVTVAGQRWRMLYTKGEHRGYEVIVGDREDVRAELVGHVVQQLFVPIGITLPLLAGLVWFGVGRGLAPLARAEREIASRSPTQLEPVSVSQVPEEIRGLVGALNHLLARLQEAIDSERRFTAHAAHELRTPLAALKTQAQVALRTPEGPERERAIGQLVQGVDRASHLVEQLLTLARLDPETSGGLQTGLDLWALASEVVSELTPVALERGIDLGINQGEPTSIRGGPTALAILIRNLLDNAIRYSPPGTRVDVGITREDGAPVLTVTDQGPGIAPEERERVLDRFYRIAGTGGQGSGLGLSIVRRIAELHGASLAFEEGPEGSGLRVRVVFEWGERHGSDNGPTG